MEVVYIRSASSEKARALFFFLLLPFLRPPLSRLQTLWQQGCIVSREKSAKRTRLEQEFTIIIDNSTCFDEERATQIGHVLLRKV